MSKKHELFFFIQFNKGVMITILSLNMQKIGLY